MSKTKWTEKWPTEPGFYWTLSEGDSYIDIGIVNVFRTFHQDDEKRYWAEIPGDEIVEAVKAMDVMWMGPIKEPDVPKNAYKSERGK